MPRTSSIVLFSAALALAPLGDVRACQSWPPGTSPPPSLPATCNAYTLTPITPVVRSGEPFQVVLSFTHRSAGPPFVQDRLFWLSPSGCTDADGDGDCDTDLSGACGTGPGFGPSTSPTPAVFVLLDDAAAPFADDPTSVVEVFEFVPEGPAEQYDVQVTIQTLNGLQGGVRTCLAGACIPAVDAPDPTPTAAFEEPVQSDEGGSIVPFSLRVERNGYPVDRPLTVRVTPENEYDPADLFPLEPSGLSTTGITVTGSEEELVAFECQLHYPCAVGASNTFQVTIHDGSTLLWDSRWMPEPPAKVFADRAPLARLELVEIEGSGCDGRLSACEGGRIHLRLYARNPSATDLEDARLELPLPDGVSVTDWDLHFHDNPLDDVTPTAEEMAAEGNARVEGGVFVVDVAAIARRFGPEEMDPPPIFEDLFEVELFLDVPEGGLGDVGTLDVGPLTVSATGASHALEEATELLRIPVGSDAPPLEVSAPGSSPLRVFPDGRLAWQGCEELWADAFAVRRGVLEEISVGDGDDVVLGAPLPPDCIASDLAVPEHVETFPPGGFHYYVVTATNCAGEGSSGFTTLDAPRPSGPACP